MTAGKDSIKASHQKILLVNNCVDETNVCLEKEILKI